MSPKRPAPSSFEPSSRVPIPSPTPISQIEAPASQIGPPISPAVAAPFAVEISTAAPRRGLLGDPDLNFGWIKSLRLGLDGPLEELDYLISEEGVTEPGRLLPVIAEVLRQWRIYRPNLGRLIPRGDYSQDQAARLRKVCEDLEALYGCWVD